MRTRTLLTIAAAVAGLTASMYAAPATWTARTPWGDPDLQGEWTTEGEYGVPFERPAQFGTRQFLTDEEYAKRIEDVRIRDERDLARVDVLSGKVNGPNAPIPHWREYNTTSRRTSLVIDPPDGRLPPRTPQARPVPVQRCGSLQRGEPCDTYEDYGLGVRCIVHGGGFPDAMFPAVYNANMRIVQSAGVVAITYELIHDTRVIPIDAAPRQDRLSDEHSHVHGRRARPLGGNDAGGRNHQPEGEHARVVAGLRLIERFTRTGKDSMDYQVTFIDPATWTAPWTAALDMKARPDDAGVFEYACHEGNYGLEHMLRTSRLYDR